MHNYPFFMNIMSIVIYVPISFMYIWPVMYFTNIITKEQREIPKFKFAVMGFYDSVAGIMQVFANNYITNASTIVLVQQSAIPISMAISKVTLNSVYTKYQIYGACIVLLGIVVVILPTFIYPDPNASTDTVSPLMNLFWIIVMVVSCVPMCLSSVYKEKALGETEVDVMYLNGWVAVFQLLVSIPLAFPSAWIQGMPMNAIWPNIVMGTKCWFGYNSVTAEFNPYNQDIDDCSMAPFYVNAYLFFNIIYNFLIILVLKHGSANILFMASTVIVPLSNVAFALPFVPRHQPLHVWDILGLFVILGGLVIYRFYPSLQKVYFTMVVGRKLSNQELEAERKAEQIAAQTSKKQVKYIGLNQMEALNQLVETRVVKAQSQKLFKSPGQIRGNLLAKLGMPPSPFIALAPGGGRNSFVDNRNGRGTNSPQINTFRGDGRLGSSPASNFSTSGGVALSSSLGANGNGDYLSSSYGSTGHRLLPPTGKRMSFNDKDNRSTVAPSGSVQMVRPQPRPGAGGDSKV